MSAKDTPGAATNLSLRVDLVRQAKGLRLILSRAVEEALERAIAERAREAWLSENEVAISSFNEEVARRGVFGDDWRGF